MKLLLSVLTLCLFTQTSFAHSGRTNSSGCHNDNINGGYHCHLSNEDNKENLNTEEPSKIKDIEEQEDRD